LVSAVPPPSATRVGEKCTATGTFPAGAGPFPCSQYLVKTGCAGSGGPGVTPAATPPPSPPDPPPPPQPHPQRHRLERPQRHARGPVADLGSARPAGVAVGRQVRAVPLL